MTRIRLFFQHMPPYSGAAALRGDSVVRGLLGSVSAPLQIEVFTTTPGSRPIEGASICRVPVAEVENSESLLNRLAGELRMGWIAARSMFGYRDGPCDLAVISTPGYLAALVIAAHARRRRIPYVIELRDVYPQVYAEAGLMRRGGRLYSFFAERSRRMYRGARLVVAATHGLAREVKEAAPETRVETVYNGFPSSLRTRSAPQHERFTVCFHGTMGFFQDIESLVRAAEVLAAHEVDVVAIGYGRKESLLREARLPNLRFLGRLPFDRTIEEVERCHLGLCLRLDDGISKDAFPVKVWEYLGLGIPSIVTPPCEAGEFLEAEGCGLQLPAGDVAGLVSAVLALKNDPQRLKAMAGRCRVTGDHYTRERTGERVGRHVLEVLRQG